MDTRSSSAFKMLFEGENQQEIGKWTELIILKKENGPRASSAPALGLNTIIFKYVYWYMKQISGERLQDHWSSGWFSHGQAHISFSMLAGDATLCSHLQ